MNKLNAIIFWLEIKKDKYFPNRFSLICALLFISSIAAQFRLESDSFLYWISAVVYLLISVISAVVFYKQINKNKGDL